MNNKFIKVNICNPVSEGRKGWTVYFDDEKEYYLNPDNIDFIYRRTFKADSSVMENFELTCIVYGGRSLHTSTMPEQIIEKAIIARDSRT